MYIVCNIIISFYFKNRTSPRFCHGFEPGHDKMGARPLVLPVRTGKSFIQSVCVLARKVVNEITLPCLLRRGVGIRKLRGLCLKCLARCAERYGWEKIIRLVSNICRGCFVSK